MKAAAYVKDYPFERDDISHAGAAQRSRLEAFVGECGWDLAGVYADVGGRPWDREALNRLLGDLGGLDCVVVTSVDRLERTAYRILQVLDRLHEKGVELVALDEGIDTRDDSWQAARKLLARLSRWEPRLRLRPRERWSVERLTAHGFAPATVIDVGAADGTLPLYEAFPDAYLVLIDPLVEYEADLARIVENRPGEYVLSALGASEGAAQLEIDAILYTSTLQRWTARERGAQTREVQVTTLDRLAAERAWEPPFGVKLDAEGSEHEILEGAVTTLARSEFVISEVSVHQRFEGAPLAREFAEQMRTHGFEFCDLLDADVTPLGVHADVLFRRVA